MIETLPLWLPGAIAMAAILLVSGFFSGSETALFFLSRDDERELQEGTPNEQIASRLLADPDRLLTAILFWNLVANLTYFAIGVVTARRLLVAGEPVLAGLINLAGLVCIIVFGEVLPKSIALARVRTCVRLVARPLAVAVRAIDAIRPLLTQLAAAIRRAVYPRIVEEPHLDPTDLERAIQLGDDEANQPAIDAFERILDLLDLTAEDVMRPRSSFKPLASDADESLLIAGDVVLRHRHEANSDDTYEIAGAHRFDVGLTADREAFRSLTFVPWSTPMAVAFEHLDAPGDIAIGVVGEYGDLIGIITWDDVLDSLVTGRASRVRRSFQREPIRRTGPGVYRVDGMTSLRVLGEYLGIDDALVERHVGESRTVAGLIQEQLDRGAVVGDAIEWNGCLLTIASQTAPGAFEILVRRTLVETSR